MCKELEAIGLPDPVYNNNTFILKTTVLSASFEHESTQNARIGAKNASIQAKNASIQGENASIQIKNVLIDKVEKLKEAGDLSKNFTLDAMKIIEQIDVMQVITSKEVMNILSCQTTKARSTLKKMESYELIKGIQGKGKGKYILNI